MSCRGGGLHIEKAVIYDIREGIYSSWLHVERPDGSVFLVDSRTTDAICLSLLMHFPVCIDEELLERERLHGISDDGSCYTVSVNNVSLDMLKKAMDDAVRVEDYERASELRDEIRRREKGNVC